MTPVLDELLATITETGGGPLVEAPAAARRDLVDALTARGWVATLVDRAPVRDRETLLHALYQACELPGWFGFNWDALLDCLSDLSPGHVLLFRDFRLLEQESPEVAQVFLEVVQAARTERETRLRVVSLVAAR
jgi:RNAse (barnase) inhibitor barstar